jgi:hypothetical protein
MSSLTEEDADRLRDVLVEHGSVYGASNCHICGVARGQVPGSGVSRLRRDPFDLVW